MDSIASMDCPSPADIPHKSQSSLEETEPPLKCELDENLCLAGKSSERVEGVHVDQSDMVESKMCEVVPEVISEECISGGEKAVIYCNNTFRNASGTELSTKDNDRGCGGNFDPQQIADEKNLSGEHLKDTDVSVIESNIEEDKPDYRSTKDVFESDSEDSESSSSSSSDSDTSDSSSESDDDDVVVCNKQDDMVREQKCPKAPKLKGELSLEELPPIQDLHINVSSEQAVEIGKVLHIVDTLVVVESYKDQPPLDIDSVLFLDHGARALGRIFDVMGPVNEPLYCVRFNSTEHIRNNNVESGMTVYSAPKTEYSHFVFVKQLLMMRGSDASWREDRETPLSEADFSDDEEEMRRKKGDGNKSKVKQEDPDQPRQKHSKFDKKNAFNQRITFPPRYRPNMRQHGPSGFQPHNPWSGQPSNGGQRPRSHDPSQSTYHNISHQPVMPSSFNTPPRALAPPPPSNYQAGHSMNSNQFYNPQHAEFGVHSMPNMFNRSPNNYPPNNQPVWGNGYDPMQENQRYLAFSSEIARLTQAYHAGAQSPMAVPPPNFNGPPRMLAPPQQGMLHPQNSNYYSHYPNS